MEKTTGKIQLVHFRVVIDKKSFEDLADLEKGNHVKFQVLKGKNGFQAVNIQRRYSGRVKLTKESYGFVIYKVLWNIT